MFACKTHWYALRPALRDAIWREYRRGQEVDKNPSIRYLAVQRRAVAELAFKPHDEEAARVAAPYFLESEVCRRQAIARGLGDPLEGIAPDGGG
jgi:hypothetical protein